MKQDRRLNILICPLEWGLGHAGRMIPLAKKLQERQNNIYIGTGKEHQSFLRNELSGITYIDFQGFKTVYSRFLPQYIAMLLRMPLLFYHIIAEHVKLKRIIRDHKIDIVISDNRMGLWTSRIKCVYITHIPVVPLPEKLLHFEWIGMLFHRYFIRKYTFCFIPDLPGVPNLTGRLTHNLKLPDNTRFIGILSRFTSGTTFTGKRSNCVHNTIILSGPEPQRSILRERLAGILNDADPPTVILEGKPGRNEGPVRTGRIISYNHLPTDKMQNIITGSELVIARSGYTTIMELISLNCSALLIPTPGQTEQEYLAKYLSLKGWFTTMTQKSIREGVHLSAGKTTWPSAIISESSELLEIALDELLNQ